MVSKDEPDICNSMLPHEEEPHICFRESPNCSSYIQLKEQYQTIIVTLTFLVSFVLNA